MFCGHFVFVVVAICCPASVQTDSVDMFYNMTNGFVDVVQPTARLIGTYRKR